MFALLQACLAFVLLLPIMAVMALHKRNVGRKKNKSIAIIVLGDIARSPRMMRHALSFADHNWLQTSKLSERLPKIFFVAIGPFKAFYLSVCLTFKLLFKAGHCSFIMVQNPPAIPTLTIVQLAKFILGSQLIIDWHNTAYSILALKFGSDQHFMVRLAKWAESQFGKYATLHLFVSQAELVFLSESWNLQGRKKVFYDRPPRSFCRLTLPEIHTFIRRSLLDVDRITHEIFANTPGLPNETIMTYEDRETNSFKFKPNRAALLVSSTSWTIDEDFNVLIDGLSIYSNLKKDNPSLPKVLCLITGKGPLKEYYEEIISEKSQVEAWAENGICCLSIWLEEAEDYRKLLGSADLGISLHQSSSGLDLPMKVVDMFGCELPVLARNFKCLPELVQHGQNGLVFDSAAELANLMEELLTGFNEQQNLTGQESMSSKLANLKKGIARADYGGSSNSDSETNGTNNNQDPTQDTSFKCWSCWEDHWEQHVLSSLESIE